MSISIELIKLKLNELIVMNEIAFNIVSKKIHALVMGMVMKMVDTQQIKLVVLVEEELEI